MEKLNSELTRLSSAIQVLVAKQEGTSQLIDERWKAMEQRMEVAARENQQTIRLVTEELGHLNRAREKVDEELNNTKREIGLLRNDHNYLAVSVTSSQDGTRRLIWTLFGGALTLASSVIAVLIVNHPIVH